MAVSGFGAMWGVGRARAVNDDSVISPPRGPICILKKKSG